MSHPRGTMGDMDNTNKKAKRKAPGMIFPDRETFEAARDVVQPLWQSSEQ